ncbi:hypothetical protein BGZ83_000296, partial [Gryganskiella cystojenkinii]
MNSDTGVTPAQPHGESSIEVLARIWPEFDHSGRGVLAGEMETILRRVEQEQGTQLLEQASWIQLNDYIAAAGQTVVSQKDLSDLLSLLQGVTTYSEVPALEHQQQLLQPPFSSAAGLEESGDRNHGRRPLDRFDIHQQHQSDQAHQNQEEREEDFVQQPTSATRLHPRHHASLSSRTNAAPIKKIALSESTQFRPRLSRNGNHSSLDDSDGDDHHSSSFHE